MTVRQPRYSKEEFARRGDEIYESQVRSQVEEGNHGRIVAIAQAIDLSKRSLLSDAFQLLDTPPNRSPQLNLFLTGIAAKACN